MKRHDFDPLAFIAGLLFVAVGGAYLIGELAGSDVDPRWVVPVVLITVGFAGLASSLLNAARRRDTPSDE